VLTARLKSIALLPFVPLRGLSGHSYRVYTFRFLGNLPQSSFQLFSETSPTYPDMYTSLCSRTVTLKVKACWIGTILSGTALICPLMGAERLPDNSKAAPGAKAEKSAPRQRISNEEMSAMAGVGPDGTFGPSDNFGKVLQAALKREPVANNGKRATYTNIKYGDHERNTFDLWVADSSEPAPLVVFIHGGGFRRGDKALLYDSKVLAELLEAGFSVAGINYRFATQSPEGTLGSLKDTARFIQFIRHHAKTYRINGDKIACYGGSAGAIASLWLAFSDDRAVSDSADPIARESTRLSCAGAMATPATQDVMKWKEILNISHDQAIAFAKALGRIENESELYSEKNIRLRQQTDIVELMSADDPPVFIHNSETGETPTHFGHMAHHPNHARVLKERANKVGIEAIVYAPEIGLVDPSGDSLVSFFVRHLQPPKSSGRAPR